ncbi:MAG: alpha/beta hydrolase [Planctomycetes bacterium]|nr:alpha/beta hydrolase [Planctomycetota bacterium]
MSSLLRSGVPLLVAVLLCACSLAPRPAPLPEPAVGAVARVPFEVDLGGWISQAELVHPAADGPYGAGPWPVVLLIHGNGPHDMDVTMRGPDGTTKLFATIADVLAARGFAVVRYHKRWVKGPGRFDARFWREQSTFVFTEDAGKVLDAALAMPACDRHDVFLYGWSEGTAVAAALAAARGDVRGLVLQGVVGLPYREMVRSWILDVGLPYAQDVNGMVTSASLDAALRGEGGLVAKLGAAFFADPTARASGRTEVSARLDTDGDGALDPEREIRAASDGLLDFAFGPQGNVHVYADGRTVPPVGDQAGRLHRLPLLVLQGANDASTPARSAHAVGKAWRAAGGRDVTVWDFPGLGHTLGPAASLFDDCGRAPTTATLAPVAGWLAAHVTASR